MQTTMVKVNERMETAFNGQRGVEALVGAQSDIRSGREWMVEG